MKYGLIGNPLSHSMSPFIHKRLFELKKIAAEYSLIELTELNTKRVSELKALYGYNVTIPYKIEIIKYLAELDASAREYMSVNTVKNGKGYNTDVYGFLKSVEKLGASLSGKVLILGGGGVARMAVTETAKSGGKITLAVRKKSFDKAYALPELAHAANTQTQMEIVDIEEICGEYDLLINCTPVGMYPDCGCPVSQDVIRNCKAVFDLIYNPKKTRLIWYAQSIGIPSINGMYMLVCQAAKAQEIWNGWRFSEREISQTRLEANAYMQKHFQHTPVFFIGFMASGKTTTAKSVAEARGCAFVDIDEEITKKHGSIEKIFAEHGEEYFRQLEYVALSSLVKVPGIVVSAGGGLPLSDRNIRLLKRVKVVYIDTPFELCYERILADGGRPVAANKAKEELKALYDSRAKVYKSVADNCVDGSLPLESKVAEILSLIK